MLNGNESECEIQIITTRHLEWCRNSAKLLPSFISANLHSHLGGRHHSYCQFTDEENEAQGLPPGWGHTADRCRKQDSNLSLPSYQSSVVYTLRCVCGSRGLGSQWVWVWMWVHTSVPTGGNATPEYKNVKMEWLWAVLAHMYVCQGRDCGSVSAQRCAPQRMLFLSPGTTVSTTMVPTNILACLNSWNNFTFPHSLPSKSVCIQKPENLKKKKNTDLIITYFCLILFL